MGFAVRATRDDSTARVDVSGELDLTTGERLERALLAAEADAPPEIVLDLARVTFFDSSGLQILLDADGARERRRAG